MLRASIKGISNAGDSWSVDHFLWLHLPLSEDPLGAQLDLHEHQEDKSWLRNNTQTHISDFILFNKREITQLPDFDVVEVTEPSSVLLLPLLLFAFLFGRMRENKPGASNSAAR